MTCYNLGSKCFCDRLGLEVVFPAGLSLLPPDSEVAIHVNWAEATLHAFLSLVSFLAWGTAPREAQEACGWYREPGWYAASSPTWASLRASGIGLGSPTGPGDRN